MVGLRLEIQSALNSHLERQEIRSVLKQFLVVKNESLRFYHSSAVAASHNTGFEINRLVTNNTHVRHHSFYNASAR